MSTSTISVNVGSAVAKSFREGNNGRGLAKHVVVSAFRSMRELTELLEMLKEHCDAAEYDAYLRGIGNVCAQVGTDIIDRVMAAHPTLKSELEAKMKKYQKFV